MVYFTKWLRLLIEFLISNNPKFSVTLNTRKTEKKTFKLNFSLAKPLSKCITQKWANVSLMFPDVCVCLAHQITERLSLYMPDIYQNHVLGDGERKNQPNLNLVCWFDFDNNKNNTITNTQKTQKQPSGKHKNCRTRKMCFFYLLCATHVFAEEQKKGNKKSNHRRMSAFKIWRQSIFFL